MMDEVKGLSAGMRFALTRQLAARCVVLMRTCWPVIACRGCGV